MSYFIRSLCTVILAVVVLFASPSCKKDSKSKSKTEILTSGSWKMTAFTINPAVDYNGDGTTETDIFALIDPCSKDDISTFKKDGTATSDEGATKCDPNDPQTTTFNWSFNTDQTKITIDVDTYDIVEFTSSQIKLNFSEVIGNTTYVRTVVFTH